MINAFLDWAQEQQDGMPFPLFSFAFHPVTCAVWIVSSGQLLDWVRDPKPVSQLDQVASLKCSTTQVDSNQKICNGMPQGEAGLLAHCAFSDFPFFTCVCCPPFIFFGGISALMVRHNVVQYGCPVQPPTPSNPDPAQQTRNGQQVRFRRAFRLRCLGHSIQLY
jgi:hypothetical protein